MPVPVAHEDALLSELQCQALRSKVRICLCERHRRRIHAVSYKSAKIRFPCTYKISKRCCISLQNVKDAIGESTFLYNTHVREVLREQLEKFVPSSLQASNVERYQSQTALGRVARHLDRRRLQSHCARLKCEIAFTRIRFRSSRRSLSCAMMSVRILSMMERRLARERFVAAAMASGVAAVQMGA